MTRLINLHPHSQPTTPHSAVTQTARKVTSSLLAALLLTTGMPAQAQDAETQALLADEAILNDRCRGGSGDDTDTWQACGARDYVGYLLSERGYCYGKDGQSGAEMEWHPCTEGSLTMPKPAFAQP